VRVVHLPLAATISLPGAKTLRPGQQRAAAIFIFESECRSIPLWGGIPRTKRPADALSHALPIEPCMFEAFDLVRQFAPVPHQFQISFSGLRVFFFLRCEVALQRLDPEPFRPRGHENQREEIRPVPSIREQRFVPANIVSITGIPGADRSRCGTWPDSFHCLKGLTSALLFCLAGRREDRFHNDANSTVNSIPTR